MLDVTFPFEKFNDKEATAFEAILEPLEPLPLMEQFPGIKNSSAFINALLRRASEAVEAIVTYPTDRKMSRLRVGGSFGMTAAMRLVEFCRRTLMGLGDNSEPAEETKVRLAPVTVVLERMEIVLAREQWRRWASSTFAIAATEGKKNAERLRVLWWIMMEAIMRSEWDAVKVSTTNDFWLRHYL